MDRNDIRSKTARAMTRVQKRNEHERRVRKITIAVIASLAGLLLGGLIVLMTSIGPGWYYNRLQTRKMAGPGELQAGYVESLYNLGAFYNSTLRAEDANRCFDEIALLYFGFSLTEFLRGPDGALDKRDNLLARLRKGDGYFGPPFKIPEGEIRYVGNAIWRTGQYYLKVNRRSTYNLFARLYQGILLAEHPNSCNEAEVKLVNDFAHSNR
jgi:hypothetical protein